MGNVHSDRNQIEVVRYLTELLSSDEWVIGCEFPSDETFEKSVKDNKEALEGIIIRKTDKFQESFTGKITFLEFASLKSEEEIKVKDPGFQAILSTDMSSRDQEILCDYINSYRFKYTSCEVERLLSDSGFEIVGVDSEAEFVNEFNNLEKERNKPEVRENRVLSKKIAERYGQLYQKRNHDIPFNSCKIARESKKNIIVLTGITHVLAISQANFDFEDMQAVYCVITPEPSYTLFGRITDFENTQNRLIQDCQKYEVTAIDIQQSEWKKALSSLTQRSSSSQRFAFSSSEEEAKDEVFGNGANMN